MNTDSYVVLGYGAHAILSTGKVRLHMVDAIPMRKGGWRYLGSNSRFVAAGPLQEEVVHALATAGPDHAKYRLSAQHAIVLYPSFITLDDLRMMRVLKGDPHKIIYSLTAKLPFAEGYSSRVDIVIDTNQTVPLIIEK